MTTNTRPRPISAKVRMGHVHFKVADLERAIAYMVTNPLNLEALLREAPAPVESH